MPDDPGADASLSRRELQDRAIRGSLWTLINVGVTLPLSIAANAIVARLLGPSEYGELAFLLTALAIALPLSELGFGQALAQWGVASEIERNAASTDLLLRSRAGFGLLVQLPLLAAGALLVLGGASSPVVTACLVAISVLVLGAAAQAALLIQNRTATLAKITLLIGVGIQVGIVSVAVRTEDPTEIFTIRLVISALAPVLAAFALSPRYRSVVFKPRWPRRLPTGFWKFSALAWIAGASALIVYSRSEVFVLRFYDQATELGLYAVAFGLGQQLTLPLDSLLAPLFPAKAALASGHPEHIRQGFLRSMRFFGLLSGGLVSLVAAVYYLVPVAFGQAYGRSATLFVVLGVSSSFNSVASPFTLITFARRRGGLLATAFAAGVVADLGLAFLLIPHYGAWGAVVANGCGQIVSIIILAKYELATQETSLAEVAEAGRAWLFGLLSILPGLLIGALAEAAVGLPAAVPAAVVASLVSFVLLLRLSGGVLTSADADAFVSLLPLRLSPLVRRALSPAMSSH